MLERARTRSRYAARRRPRAAPSSPRASSSRHQLAGGADRVVGLALHAARAPAGSSAKNTSWRRASTTATTVRFDGRSGYATRSRLGTPTTGIRSTCAMTFAVVTPTRRPVNRPGPIPTATAASWSSSTPVSCSRYSIAGTSCSAWRAAGRASRDSTPEHAVPVADRDADLRASPCRSRARALRRSRTSASAATRASARSHPRSRLPSVARWSIARVVVGSSRPVQQRSSAPEAVGGQRTPRRARPTRHTITASPSSSSSRPRSSTSWTRSRRYTSTCTSGTSAPSYSRTMVNVGLTTGSVDARAPRRSPCANTVLPAPSSPASTTTSPALAAPRPIDARRPRGSRRPCQRRRSRVTRSPGVSRRGERAA